MSNFLEELNELLDRYKEEIEICDNCEYNEYYHLDIKIWKGEKDTIGLTDSIKHKKLVH